MRVPEAARLDTLHTAETPEGIALSLRPAGVMARCLAWLLDFLVRAVLFVIIAIAGRAFGGLGTALLLIAFFALEWLYPVVFELSRSGATPGKRAMGLRVVMDSGLPVTPAASFIRNLLRTADFLPAMYAAAVATMLLRDDSKRLGDLAAGTLVVKERRGVTLASLTSGAVAPFPAPAPGEALPQPTLANIGLLNDQDYNLVQEFLGRRSELGREARARLGVQLAGNIQVRLGLPQGGDAERFLQYVAGEYQLLKRQQQLSSE